MIILSREFSKLTTTSFLNAVIVLSRYVYKKYPELFASELETCIWHANVFNPLCKFKKIKSRHPKDDDELSWSDKNKITAFATHLYFYLQRISKTPPGSWPDYIHGFFKTYNIETPALATNLAIREQIISIVEQYDGRKFRDRFWRTFVTDRHIPLENIQDLKRCTPENDPFLKDLFHEFMK